MTARIHAASFLVLLTVTPGCSLIIDGSNYHGDGGIADTGVADSGGLCTPACGGADFCLDGTCVECLDGTTCTSGICTPEHACAPPASCSDGTPCPSTRPFCEASICVECRSAGDCGTSPDRTVCEPTGHVCVQCLSGADCPTDSTCTAAHTCEAPTACTTSCPSPMVIDTFGRCVASRDCPMTCGGIPCNSRSGLCQPSATCPSCPGRTVCDGFGQCVPGCACDAGKVYYSSTGRCDAPATCTLPEILDPNDPTRCFEPCEGECASGELCVDGECRAKACSGGPTPFECAGSTGAGMPLPFPLPPGVMAASALPAMRVVVLPTTALMNRIAVVPSPGDAGTWGVLWADDLTVNWSTAWAHTLAGQRECYAAGPGTPLPPCTGSEAVAVSFAPRDFDAVIAPKVLGPDVRLGATAAANSGLWQLNVSTGTVCGGLAVRGDTAADSLVGRIAVARTFVSALSTPIHRYGLTRDVGPSAGYPATWRGGGRDELPETLWNTAVMPPSLPNGDMAAAGSIAFYRTQDDGLVAWNGKSDASPVLVPGFDHLIGGPAAAIEATMPAGTGATIVAPRKLPTGMMELISTTCTLTAGGVVNCSASATHRSIPADDSRLISAALHQGQLYTAVTEPDLSGARMLTLHTGDGALALLQQGNVGAPIDEISAVDLQFVIDGSTVDLVWGAIAKVRRSTTSPSELWVGAVRLCM